MNLLAHIFLSGDDQELLIGNFIGDHVKGNKKFDYPDGIRRGIELHRAIDHFTDTHPITAQGRKYLYERHSKYSGVVLDLFYDHFLAANFNDFSKVPLEKFTREKYALLNLSQHWFPEKVKHFYPFMVERDWLTGYATIDGIGRTLTGLSRRVSFENRMHEATADLVQFYEPLEKDFKLFFPELIRFTSSY